ncbi:MAG: NAD-dependent epimerase/dehydratase family protein [Candidatus Nanohaloarchaea archaeon]
MGKVLVTGAAGFIGSHMVEELLDRGYEVVGIDNFHPYYSPDIKRDNIRRAEKSEGDFEFIEGSILAEKDLQKLPEEPEYVFHEAAISGVRHSLENPEPYFRINVAGTARLLDYIEDTEKFVYPSSSSVYGEVSENELPVTEGGETDPVVPYALSKLQAEQVVEQFESIYDLPTVKLRYFSVYGPRQRPDEAFTKFISKALNDETIPIYGDGEQSRDFTHVSDIVDGTIMAGENGSGTYNLGSGRRVTVNQMVETLDQIMEEEIETEHVEQPEGDVKHTQADISRAKDQLRYSPDTDFKEGVESCIRWVEEVSDHGLLAR